MDSILAVAQYTLKQHIRHRIYLAVVLFGVILLSAGLIVSTLALDEQIRMILNVGLGTVEFLALVTVIFLTVSLILEEVETRSIYLILSHPIERWQYVMGRFLGTIISLCLGILIMMGLHLIILFWKGWSWDVFYPIAILCATAKIIVVGSLALLISLITTSSASSMVVTAFLWILGHFTSEIQFMADKSESVLVKSSSWVVRHLVPNFEFYNYRDFWDATQVPGPEWWAWMVMYSICYVGMALLFSSWFVSKREF